MAHDFSAKLDGAKFLSLKLIANNHLSILCAVTKTDKVIPQISIWDNRFGTLQSEIDIDTITLHDKLNRTQGLLNGFYDESGYFLTLSLSKLTSSTVNTMHLLFPMKIQKISVKSSLGKLAKSSQIANALAELKIDDPSSLSQDCLDLNALNGEYHACLTENVTKDKFEYYFRMWLESNTDFVSKTKRKVSNQGASLHWTDRPAMSISQIQMKDIARACFENSVGLWPRNVIKYCLNNGMLFSAILDSSLIEKIISKDDIELLWIAAHKLLDISENDLSLILKYVLGISDTKELDMRISNDQSIEIGEAQGLSCGQEYICHLVLNAPRNNHLMIRALSILQVEEVEKLLIWIWQVVSMEDERFMWWIWDGIGSDKSREKLDGQFQQRKKVFFYLI